MNNTFLAFFIFIVILFVYIHVTAQWKTSDDLEIYEADYESASHLQEICSVKQPVVFKFQKEQTAIAFFERFQASNFEKHDNIDIRVKDRRDYNHTGIKDKEKDYSVDYVPLSFRSARRLMTTDTTAKYFSEKNHAFLEESGLDKLTDSMDPLLKPPLSAYTKHDILLGSPLVNTPLRYRRESHHFIAVTRGKIHVKLCPPKYSKIIPHFKDYENYEFWSPLNIWANEPSQHNRDILQKIKIIEIDVHTGDILFIPPYWWYSVSFSGDSETTAASFVYDIAMNIVAQSNHWGLYYLQQNNIKNRPAKTIVFSEDGEAGSSSPLEEVAKNIMNSIPDESDPGILTDESSSRTNKEIVTNAGIYKPAN